MKIQITLEEFKIIKAFYSEFTRKPGIETNDFTIGWSELMPVVEKIFKMYKWNEFHYNPDSCYFYCSEKIKIVVSAGGGVDEGTCGEMIYKYLNSPHPVYKAVLEFIQWHTSQTKEK